MFLKRKIKKIKDRRSKRFRKEAMKMSYFRGQDVVLENDLSNLEADEDLKRYMMGSISSVVDVNPYTGEYKVERNGESLWVKNDMIDRDGSEDLQSYTGLL